MYNELQYHKRSDTVKWVIAFFLIAILLVGMAASLYINLRPDEATVDTEQTQDAETNPDATENENTDVVTPVEPTSAPDAVSGGVITLEGTKMESQKVYAMSKSMTFTSPSANSRSAPSGVTIEATVFPVSATDKTVDWAIEFVDSTTEWAADKTVTDFVTVTPESDGSNVATVVCLQPFAEEIKITVTSRNNINATAECIVNYRAKISFIQVVSSSITDNVESGTLVFLNSNYHDGVEAGAATGAILINPLDTTTLAPEYKVLPTASTVGAVDILGITNNYHVDMKMTMSPELIAALENAGFTVTNANGYTFINGGKNNGSSASTTGLLGFGAKVITLLGECTNYDNLTEDEQKELLNFVITYTDARAFRLQVGYTDSATEEISEFLDTYCDIILNAAVTSIELSPESLEF